MNAYFCYSPWDDYAFPGYEGRDVEIVIAPTRGSAVYQAMKHCHSDWDFIDWRARLIEKDTEYPEGVLETNGSLDGEHPLWGKTCGIKLLD